MPDNAAVSDTDFVEMEEGAIESHAGPVEAEANDVAEGNADLVEVKEEVAEGDASHAGAEREDTVEDDSVLGEAKEEVAEDGVGLDEGEVEDVAEGEASLGEAEQEQEEEKKKKRRLLLLLLLVVTLLLCVCVMFCRYLLQPAPLPELLPIPVDANYPPHYLFSIYGVEQPVGVALSPQGDRIYVAETGGDRLIQMFDRDGNPLGSFAPPRTRHPERSPVYLAVDSTGRVFATDRLQHAVFVYDQEGNYLDTILAPDLTLSEYVSKHVNGLLSSATIAYNLFETDVYYQNPGEVEQTLPVPSSFDWAPLGIRIDETGNMLMTDVDQDRNVVRRIPAAAIQTDSWHDFDPPQKMFGETGQGNGQLLFPNSAVSDSQGWIYVTDGNNGRISVWDGQGNFLFTFGRGTGDGALNLPRGAAIDGRSRLYVVDAVGQNVKVYDVSGPEPSFLFAFGDWGPGDGQFDYPNDIALDATGRLYIADRENDRVQVWSY